jgi:four helix bundle protein
MLDLHKLDAYRVSLEFRTLVLEMLPGLPRGFAGDADQIQRSSKAIVRNIAEGAGRWSAADKAKHYAIARGEAVECVSCFDLMKAERVVDDDCHARAIVVLERLVSLLTGLVKNPK